MREILFRGKDTDTGEWVYGGLISIDYESVSKNKPTHCIVKPNTEFYRGEIAEFCFVDPKSVGQFTGLTDKNGKKIFEGDILHIVSECCNYNFKTSVGVKYGYKSGLYVDGEFDGGDFNEIGFAFDYWQNEDAEIEVIGNIHDNPELLEG